MQPEQLEQFFFRPSPTTAAERAAAKRESSDRFRPPPVRPTRAPYRLDLASVLPTRTQAIAAADRLVFHAVGDTGGVNGTGAQQNIADHMTRQVRSASGPGQPAFFYHLGDVVYYQGEMDGYHDQFYHPYEDYPGPIFAIPGNHDGNTADPARTLDPFLAHFCADAASLSPEAGHSDRPTMIQPNCYWTLLTPVATIVGLYSNVSGELDNADAGETTQADWLTTELAAAPADKALLLAVHHPLFSLGKHGGTRRVREAVEGAMDKAGRMPDAILTGHDHCYQRFTWKRAGRRIPVLVAGAGGFAGYSDLTRVKTDLEPPKGVKLKASNDLQPGFLRLTVTRDRVTGEYFTVPDAGSEAADSKRRDQFTLNLTTHELE